MNVRAFLRVRKSICKFRKCNVSTKKILNLTAIDLNERIYRFNMKCSNYGAIYLLHIIHHEMSKNREWRVYFDV